MKSVLLMIFLMTLMNSTIIFDFNQASDLQHWKVVDDTVMGGESSGNFSLNAEGFGVFEGRISLENNGGFSSVRYSFKKINVQAYTQCVIKLKGDGKQYQFRLKSDASDFYSYIAPFSTSGEWEEITISLKEMYPTFRGRRLDRPNYAADQMEEITFLIGNKKSEQFKLLIDTITLQ